MAAEYSLLIRKKKPGSLIGSYKATDLLSVFGYAAVDIAWPIVETKDIASRDWPGEDGEDVYIPSTLSVKAYDMEIELCYKGSIADLNEKYNGLRDFLTGKDGEGAELEVYDSYHRIGRKGIYVKKFDPEDYASSPIDSMLSVSVIFRVTDPVSDIIIKPNLS